MEELDRPLLEYAKIVGLYLCMFLLIFTLVILIRNISLLKESPMKLAIQKGNFVSCTCYDSEGMDWDYNVSGPMPMNRGSRTFNFELPKG